MAVDKKISELPIATGIFNGDTTVLVRDGTDYQFNFGLALSYIANNISVGCTFTFGETAPQNTNGKNGDVFLKTDTGAFFQRLNGVWSNVYTPPDIESGGNTIIYADDTPATATGKNGDTYIDTLTGLFYKKNDGAWSPVFSLASGPPGPRGNSILNGTANPTNVGINGDFYLNYSTYEIFGPKASGTWPSGTSLKGGDGNTILNGFIPPSNSTGNNGDFYINTTTYYIYGPKLNDVWPAGVSLAYTPPDPIIVEIPENSSIPFTINYSGIHSLFGNDPVIITETKTGSSRIILYDVGVKKNYTSGVLTSIDIYGHDSGDGLSTIDDLTITIKA